VSNFCEHCEGQRFDRSRVLRALRQLRSQLRQRERGRKADNALGLAIAAVKALEIPHLEREDDEDAGQIVH
jgi:hypothetical protein